MRRVVFAVTALLASLFGAAQAVEPDEVLSDPALEARARAIDAQLRCVVCQSQAIADSDAPLAKDMRILVRERLKAGDSDAETMAYLVDRYGDYVLLKPPVQTNTLVLWILPAVMLAGGAMGAAMYIRRAQTPQSPPVVLDDAAIAEAERIARERG